MKGNRLPILVTLLSLLFAPCTASGNDFRTRHSVEIEKSIGGNAAVSADYELRTKNDASTIDSHRFTAGASYKLSQYLSLGAFYSFIGKFNSSSEMKNIHHRFFGEVTGRLPFGKWELSLRERVQYTRMTEASGGDDNPLCLMELKSRLKLSYNGFGSLSPYAATEVRNSIGRNAAFNRVRWTLGSEWSLGEHSAIDVYMHFDEVLSSGSWTSHTTLAMAYKFLF